MCQIDFPSKKDFMNWLLSGGAKGLDSVSYVCEL